MAATPLFWIRLFCSRGSLTPVAAPNVSPNVFFGMRITGFVLADEDVSAPGPSVEAGTNVPSYSGGFLQLGMFSELFSKAWLWDGSGCFVGAG